jgi:hypothetical protein
MLVEPLALLDPGERIGLSCLSLGNVFIQYTDVVTSYMQYPSCHQPSIYLSTIDTAHLASRRSILVEPLAPEDPTQ